ncbi:MAG TPA: bifunctional hydroxymethylpyrimidine kinase/phosphomethylpyrimidine kinase [Vicinamibacterales bacterium]|nr:bifunctional hydroxymethylpyrimidine kinase/phosphomethylpyrimidine kinase [Vicinamibacterales bacterium]
MRAALTIAGSDSSGGAGIQADLKTFAAFGVYGLSAITAVTAQSTTTVNDVAPLAADFVIAQIEAVSSDLPIHAVKTGMLANAAIVEAVAATIRETELPCIVVDPVFIASSGRPLLDEDGLRALCAELLPLAMVVTPNIPEAEALSGLRIRSSDEARDAAIRIHKRGAAAVVITGGHAPGSEIVDLLFDGTAFVEFRTPRIDSPHTHGTGCTFASAVAACVALGTPLTVAVAEAQAYVTGAIRNALPAGGGRNPLNHFWRRYT